MRMGRQASPGNGKKSQLSQMLEREWEKPINFYFSLAIHHLTRVTTAAWLFTSMSKPALAAIQLIYSQQFDIWHCVITWY